MSGPIQSCIQYVINVLNRGANCFISTKSKRLWIPLRMSADICMLGKGYNFWPLGYRISVGKCFLHVSTNSLFVNEGVSCDSCLFLSFWWGLVVSRNKNHIWRFKTLLTRLLRGVRTLNWIVGVTTATQQVWLTWFTGPIFPLPATAVLNWIYSRFCESVSNLHMV